jgi:chromosome segregation ATPase
MTARVLTAANSLGCVILIGLVVLLWNRERGLNLMLEVTTRQLADAREETLKETTRRQSLERDIAVLKEAIEATQKAAETTTRELSEKSVLAISLQTELDAARTQITAWEAAIKARDERIKTLGNDLSATRKRLDEAIARIKAAAK